MRVRWYQALRTMAGVLGVLCSRPARAAEVPACAPLALEADSALRARFPELVEDTRAAFARREDIDTCARVQLELREHAIFVAVALRDGRSAQRIAQGPEDVGPALEALLLVPEARAAQAERDPPAAAPGPAAPAAAPTSTVFFFTGNVRDELRSASNASDARPSSALRVELDLAAGARTGDGQTVVSLGGLTLFDVASWLIAIEGRFNRFGAAGDQVPPKLVFDLGLLGGHRFWLGDLALDLVAGPELGLPASSVQSAPVRTGVTPAPMPRVYSNSPRARVAARLNLGARSVLRAFAAIDGELAFSRHWDGTPDSLPLYGIGLALGAAVGTP